MFEMLYNTVFPAFGHFFGWVFGILNTPYVVLIDFLTQAEGAEMIYFTNLFTGVRYAMGTPPSILTIFSEALALLLSPFSFIVPDFGALPTWSCFLIVAVVFACFTWLLTALFKLIFP